MGAKKLSIVIKYNNLKGLKKGAPKFKLNYQGIKNKKGGPKASF